MPRPFKQLILCLVLAACGGPRAEGDDGVGGRGGTAASQGGASPLGGNGAGGRVAPSSGGSSLGGNGASGATAMANGGSLLGGAAGSSGGSLLGGAAGSSGGSQPVTQGGVSGGGAGGSGGVAASGGTSAAFGGAGGVSGGGGGKGPITVWLAGDSTMANGETPCPVGWGKVFGSRFQSNATVTNNAVGGRSIRTWLYNVLNTMDAGGECQLEQTGGSPTLQARWTAMLNGMKPGDYLLIQFGINDGDSACPRHVGLEAFKASLGMMASAAKQRGASPIFLTPVSAIACTGNTPRGTRGGYVTATMEAAAANDVPVIDLHALSVALYTSLGFCPIPGGDVSASTTGPVGTFFCDDHTHFDTSGAEQIAAVVAKALRDQKLPLASYLK